MFNLPIFRNPIFQNLPPAVVKSVGLQDFNREVLQSDRPVFVDFWGEGCMPCRALAPVLEKFAIDHAKDAKVVKVNINNQPALAQYFQVDVVPTIILIHNKKAVVKSIGLVKRDQLEEMLKLAA